MTVAIDYAPPPEGTLPGQTPGLRVAVDDLLKAWLRYGEQKSFVFRPHDEHALAQIRILAKAAGVDPDARCVALDPRTPAQNLGSISCLFRPDPALADAAWMRGQLGVRGPALCGLLHTLSGDQVTHVLQDLLLAPVDPSDALICPSRAIRSAVLENWEIAETYLDKRFGGTHECPIQTPILPLGIDTAKFRAARSDDKRAAQRAALGVDEDEIVILFTGRLSFVTKAHPLPLLLAARQAAAASKAKIRLIFHGYYQPQKEMQPRFQNLIESFKGPLPCSVILSDDPRFPDGLWAAADIFASLVENVQESFGLTPIEAGAGGLPAVVTDWDGYRDGILEGQTGFLIPTGTPPIAAGQDIATHTFDHRNYGLYLAGAAQSTFLDIRRAAEAFQALAENKELRTNMGNAARAHTATNYDWAALIPRYEELWLDLAERRRGAPAPDPLPQNWQAAHPDFPNPLAVFKDFPTRHLTPEARLRVLMTNEEISLILSHDMNCFVPELLLPSAVVRQIVDAIRAKGTLRLQDLLSFLPAHEHNRFWRSVGWLLKHGICDCEAD